MLVEVMGEEAAIQANGCADRVTVPHNTPLGYEGVCAVTSPSAGEILAAASGAFSIFLLLWHKLKKFDAMKQEF